MNKGSWMSTDQAIKEAEKKRTSPKPQPQSISPEHYAAAMSELATALDENKKIKAQAKQDADILKSDLLIFSKMMRGCKQKAESEYNKNNQVVTTVIDSNDPSIKIMFTFDPYTGKLIEITTQKG